jgi:Dolichyl-phosphate-mannose-protein mannosyltransferase
MKVLRTSMAKLGRSSGHLHCSRLRSVVLASAALAAVTYCVLVASNPPETVPEPFSLDSAASWITTGTAQQSTACFRLDLSICAKVVNAWISVASNGGFEILANGNTCARYFLLRTPQPFQSGLSETGQRLTSSNPAIAIRYPQYQWSDHDNAELPTWLDLTSVLRLGHNALCVEVESCDNTPAMIVSGEVLLETGERIPIRSGTEWIAESVPQNPDQDSWTSPESLVLNWNHAKPLPWKRPFWRLLPEGIYQEPFRGKRIRSIVSDSVSWLEQDWDLSKTPAKAFLRVATDSPFQVWINGRRIQVHTKATSVFAGGPWFVQDINGATLNGALEAQPEHLPSNDIATLLPAQHDETPQPSDPVVNNRGQSSTPLTERGKRIIPLALTRDRRQVEFLAYSITPLLRQGRNTIRIGLYKDEPEAASASWQPMLAFDGESRMADGDVSWLASGEATQCSAGTLERDNAPSNLSPVLFDGSLEPKSLPAKRFLGCVYPDRPWFALSLALFCISVFILFIGAARASWLAALLQRHQSAFAVLAGWVYAGLTLRSAMAEQSEALFWRLPVLSWLLLGFGLFGAALAMVLPFLAGKRSQKEGTDRLEPNRLRIRTGNRRLVWSLLAGSALVMCFAVRAWQIDFHPIDDDEYASIQASTAIAAKGIPEYQEGVWYTRSPLYHYLAGGVAFVSGGNIFALRLLSVFFACGTAVLLWKFCQELTHSRLLALAVLILYAIHPYLVYTGHVARFYQQQQFFHLLGLCFFLRGFVWNSGMRDRYLAVAALCAAALSQEITVLQILPFTVCYALFAQRRPLADETRILVAAGCALAIIALDVAFFQIRCLTALDGVSPNVEATIGWRFDNPTSFFMLIVGYSRLHLVLSAFLIGGFVIALFRRQQVWLCLYSYLFLSVVVANLFITLKSLRYEYALIPLWILLSIHAVAECARLLVPARAHFPTRTALTYGWLSIIILSWSPWRLFESYHQRIMGDSTGALRYVAENLRPGDRVAITEPHPHAALFETGQCDYALSIPILYDYVVRRQGELVDRNGGAHVIGNLENLQQAFAKNERLWIVFNRAQAGALGTEIPWQNPAARIQLYLRSNSRLVFRSYLWSVYLWDRNAGQYLPFREKPGSWFE